MTERFARRAWPACVAVLAGLGLAPGACSPLGMAAGAGAGAAVVASQERGFQGAMRDTEIRLEINRLWFQEDATLFRGVNLQVQEGRILLTGTVPDPDTRLSVVRLAWQAPGVKEVINEIEVADTSSLSDAARDAWISAQLRAKLLADPEVGSIDYSIETVNRVLYLMGVARTAAELDRVIRHAKNIAYLRRVVSYVRVKDQAAPSS
ncbi:MAG: BON domain-containing protein [Kiloniellaceae bacterium]